MLRVIFAPVRFTVFVLLGALVLSVTNCVPEQGDTNPPHKMGEVLLTLSKYCTIIITNKVNY